MGLPLRLLGLSVPSAKDTVKMAQDDNAPRILACRGEIGCVPDRRGSADGDDLLDYALIGRPQFDAVGKILIVMREPPLGRGRFRPSVEGIVSGA